MELQQRITADMNEAVKAQRDPERTVLRGLVAAIRNAEIAQGGELDEAALTKLLGRQLKQRQESVAAYQSRPELAAAEQAEAQIIARYLPKPIDDQELAGLVTAAIAETGATTPADIGQVMGVLAAQTAGRVDNAKVAALVKAKLG